MYIMEAESKAGENIIENLTLALGTMAAPHDDWCIFDASHYERIFNAKDTVDS